jgi:hypothetical protein
LNIITNAKLVPIISISSDFKKLGKEKMTGTGGLQRIPKGFVSSYQILLHLQGTDIFISYLTRKIVNITY